MALGRGSLNVVYEAMGKPKYSSNKLYSSGQLRAIRQKQSMETKMSGPHGNPKMMKKALKKNRGLKVFGRGFGG